MSDTGSFAEFKNRPAFDVERTLWVGVEWEGLVYCRRTGKVVPRAAEILNGLDPRWFAPELSAAQVEIRTSPCPDRASLADELFFIKHVIDVQASKAGLDIKFQDLGPMDMPLDVTNQERYYEIAKALGEERLRAACRCLGFHVHVGMPDAGTALAVYNAIAPSIRADIKKRANDPRLQEYRKVQSAFAPPQLESWHELYHKAVELGFAGNLRNCWWMLRLTEHGTLENRLAGAGLTLNQAIDYAWSFREQCRVAVEEYRAAA